VQVGIRGASKSFGSVEALRETSIEIADREFMSLVGPSGSGKSTLVRLLAGLEHPTTGEILFDGKAVQDLPANRRDIAMVFQSYALYPHMTVEQNLAFPLRMLGTAREELRTRVRETAEMLGIEELLARRPRELSGGQRQRVALGRAIVRRPGLFLLDEPLSNLDAKMRIAMRTEIKRLHRLLKTTFVYVTHDQAEALTMSDRITVLDRGMVQQVGTPAQVYGAPANRFVAEFIGSPPMAMLRGRIEAGDGKRRFVASGMSLELPDRYAALPEGEVVMGARSEDVLVFPEPAEGTWEANVYTREPLGSDLYLTLETGGVLIRARVDADLEITDGQRAWVSFRKTRLHFFDPRSDRALEGGNA